MGILFLCLGIVAAISGFVGLVVLLKGFLDKNNKNIKLGTILMCVMLVIGVCGSYYIVRHAVDSRRYHEQMHKEKMKDCMKNCDMGMMGGCGMGMMKGMCMGGDDKCMKGMNDNDSVQVKVIVDKQCCKKDAAKTCPNQKKK